LFTEDEATNFKGSIQIITAANQLKFDSDKVKITKNTNVVRPNKKHV